MAKNLSRRKAEKSRKKIPLKAKKTVDLSRRKVPLKADFLPLFMLFLIIAGAVGTYYFFGQYNKIQKLPNNPQQVANVELKELIGKVEKLIELPKDEIPTIATVSDLSKLKNQSFFANAKKDDKILIYTKAKKAYLYRPSENKIIEVAAINLNEAK